MRKVDDELIRLLTERVGRASRSVEAEDLLIGGGYAARYAELLPRAPADTGKRYAVE